MKLQNLTVQARGDRGKGPAGRARREGLIPAVMYGGEGETVALMVDSKIFTGIVHGDHGEHALIQLEVEGDSALSGPVMVKDIQHHPIRGHVMHADLLRIRLDEKLQTLVEIVLTGRAKGVVEGGVLDHQLREIEIECLALDVPDAIETDISHLEIGDSVHVSELIAPEGVEFVTPPERAVAAIHAPRVETTTEDEEAAALEAEDAAAEGEEGEKKAEGDEKKDD